MASTKNHFDAAIVGAGPAGAHLATRLARAGASVALFDPKAPWEKPCGGGITHKAWSRFPFLRDDGLPRNEVFHSLQISPGRRFFVIDQGHALLMVSRRALGERMLGEAIRAGAVHRPQAVTRVGIDDGRRRVFVDGDSITADLVVGADGVRSVVRDAFLGPLPKERTLGAICQFYEGGPVDPTIVRVTPFPGYCWSFPRTDCLGVGAGAMQKGGDLKGELQRFLQDFYPGRKPLGPPQGALLPYIYDWRAYREPRAGAGWALIGDAAGFVDTLTGEGIGYAVWSADLLADAIVAGRPPQYEAAWRRAFGWHLLTGAFAARRIFTPGLIDRFFTAITVCPSWRGAFMDFVWNLPPYQLVALRAARALPQTLREWRDFQRAGGRLDPALLGPFRDLARHVAVDGDSPAANLTKTGRLPIV
jgi:geranylgeranyl reductase family protein